MPTKKKTGKSKKPSVFVDERGARLPVVSVKPPPLYYRIPARLRTPEKLWPKGVEGVYYEPERVQTFEKVQQDWWDKVPGSMAEKYLTAAFGGKKLTPEPAGSASGFVTVKSIGSPSRWTPAQQKAWSDFEGALAKSILEAEKTWHGQIDVALKERRAREKAEKDRARAEAEADRLRRAAEREAARVEAAERKRKEEWARAVKRYGEEGAALRLMLAGPSKAPVVQTHLKKMRLEAEQRQQEESRRFSLLETDPEQSRAHVARRRLVERLQGEVEQAIDLEDRRRAQARLNRARAGLLRKGSAAERAAWEDLDRRDSEAISRRFVFDSPSRMSPQLDLPLSTPSRISPSRTSPSRTSPSRTSPSRISPSRTSPSRTGSSRFSPSRTSPSRVSPVDTRSVAERIASPHGRYAAQAAWEKMSKLPEDIARQVDMEAKERAAAKVGELAERGDARAWRLAFNREYEKIKRELFSAAEAQLAEERELARQQDTDLDDADRFTLLEID